MKRKVFQIFCVCILSNQLSKLWKKFHETLEVSDILKIVDVTGESDPPTQQSPPLIICHSKYYKIWMNYNMEPWTEMLCALHYIVLRVGKKYSIVASFLRFRFCVAQWWIKKGVVLIFGNTPLLKNSESNSLCSALNKNIQYKFSFRTTHFTDILIRATVLNVVF